mgnify:CR=1 FL=1
MDNTLNCGFCNKKFEKKTNYEVHLITCEEIYKHINNNDDEDNYEPTNKMMFKLIKSLMNKCSKLENELIQMKKITNREKKKINILDWLNNNYNNINNDFNHFIEHININDNELNYFFENNYILGILNILKNNLLLENEENHPIKCFNEKKNTFFKYEIETKWTILEYEEFNKMITKINHKLFIKFNEWKIKNQYKIDNDDNFNDLFLKYRKIIMGENKNRFDVIRLVKCKLFQYLKLNLKKIIDYEYTI